MLGSPRNVTVATCLYRSLLSKSSSRSRHSFHPILPEKCSSTSELKQIHSQIILHGFANDVMILGKLISFSAVSTSGNLSYAQYLFDRAPQRNKFMYNSLIRGYANSQDPRLAVCLYSEMMGLGYSPNEFTLPFVLKASARMTGYWEGVMLHGQIIKMGYLFHLCVQNVLMNVYVVCSLMVHARRIFDEIEEKSLVSWNSLMSGYYKSGSLHEAYSLFKEMKQLGVEGDKFTLVTLLSACSEACVLSLGRQVHSYIETSGVMKDIFVENSLIDMYAKCGSLSSAQSCFDRMQCKNVVSWTSLVCAFASEGFVEDAQRVFDQMSVKNVVSWNSMICCYVRESRYKEAVDLFDKMCDTEVLPDETTIVTILSACSQLGDLILGKKVHSYLRRNDNGNNITFTNAIIDMYAKCGLLDIALDIFFEMPGKNVVSWNVIISALALHGRGSLAIDLFEQMQLNGVHPDGITFTGLLSACSHSGLVDAGRYYFDRMSSTHNVSHDIEHYACMVDLLGRGGLLEEAVRLIGSMPMKPDKVVWGALLGACRTHSNVMIAKLVLKQILELERHSSGLYVLVSNIFCEARRWDDMKKIRMLMNEGGIIKSKAISLIEIDGLVHAFLVDDKRHYASTSIRFILDQLTDHLKSLEYLSSLASLFSDTEEM